MKTHESAPVPCRGTVDRGMLALLAYNAGGRGALLPPGKTLHAIGYPGPDSPGLYCMAVSCHVAFGHYLRTLRERRGLALEDVWTLSQTFPESLNKGYLSRCENGKQKLALPKVVALSRIYEVPSDVLLERLELDLELEKIGGPPTENLSWAQLREAGKNASQHGHRWAAYAFMRDATFSVAKADVDEASYASSEEQVVGSFINLASAASGLRKHHYAEHEFKYAESTGVLGPHSRVLVAERLAVVNLYFGDYDVAQEFADEALKRLKETKNCPFEAFVYSIHGLLKLRLKRQSEAINWYQKAYDAFRTRRLFRDSGNALTGIADCYYELGNYRAATKTLEVAFRLCDEYSLEHVRAIALALQGIIDQTTSRPESAEDNLRMAKEIARKQNNRVLRFQIDFYLFKQALALNQKASARAIHRRLSKLLWSIPESVEQVAAFKALEGNLADKK